MQGVSQPVLECQATGASRDLAPQREGGEASERPADRRKPSSVGGLAKAVPIVLGALTLSGFWLALLGYGFTLGISAAFGIPPAPLSESALELIKFGSDALIQTFDSVYPLRAFNAVVARAYSETSLVIVLGIAALLALFPLRWLRKKWKPRGRPVQRSAESNFRRRVLALVALEHRSD